MKKLIMVLMVAVLSGCQYGSQECRDALNTWENTANAQLHSGVNIEQDVTSVFGDAFSVFVNPLDHGQFQWTYLVKDPSGNICEARYVYFTNYKYDGFSMTGHNHSY